MEFLPPIAHKTYLKSDGGISVPTVFENLHTEYQNTDLFNNPEKFVSMYIANNSHKLGFETFKNYKAFEEKADSSKDGLVDKYIRIFNPDIMEYETFQVRPYSVLEKVYKRGIPNMVVEYHDGPSYFNSGNNEEGNISSKAEEKASSQTNQKVKQNVTTAQGLVMLFGEKLNIEDKTFKTEADIDAYVEAASKKLINNKNLDTTYVEYLLADLKSIATQSKIISKSSRNKNVPLDTIFKERFKAHTETFSDATVDNLINQMC
jgi:hypothetical protein